MPIPDQGELVEEVERKDAHWSPAPNSITGMEEEPRLGLLGVVVDRDDVEAAVARAVARAAVEEVAAPPAIDWRNVGGKNYITAVKNQGNCGSCVSFCACAILESMLLIKQGLTTDVSEADLHFCSSHGANCGGWWPSNAMSELQGRGVPDEACFPYASAFDASGKPSCKTCSNRDARAYKITGSTVVATMTQRKAWLAANGPLCAVMHVYDDFFPYSSGVYKHVTGGHAGYHCISVIGYSDAEGCWIAKNSWGPGWGNGGFFKIAYGECGIDETSNDTDPSGAVNRFPMWGINAVTVPAAPARWSGWEDLGGIIIDGPAAASWASNRIDVFATGTDNAMHHRWWDGSAWRGWESLGGVIDDAPAAVSWGPNRIDCFARGTDNRLYHRWWDGTAWRGWESLGGLITSGPAAASWGPNRIDVFAKGANNAMWHLWWDGTAWRGWENLGGVIEDAPAAVSWGPNRIDCFARGADNHLHHRWWDGTAWRGWEDLGGVIFSGPTAASWAANRLDVFAKGTDSAMWHRWWDGSAWRGWESLGGVIDDAPGAVSWGPNRIDCFVRGMNNHLFHKWYA
jgi:C1A family cysteine protease